MTEKKETIEQTILKFQNVFSGVDKNRVNDFTKSKYANLDDVWNSIKDHLQNLEISVIQKMYVDKDQGQVLKTIIKNSSGDSVESDMLLMLEKQTPQGMGSALTYARRYSLCCLLGIVETEDDDANGIERQSEIPLTDKQKGEILQLIEDTNTEASKFTDYLGKQFGKQGIDELSYSQASIIVSQLKTKLKNAKK